jgi:hypothetical protein
MNRRRSMQRIVVLARASCLSLLLAACNPKLGFVLLDTNPSQATVFLDANNIGETPVRFDLDLEKPVMLRILKEGYVPVTEHLNLYWAQREYRDGHYTKGNYLIKGEMQGGFQIQTTRDLKEDLEAKRQAQRREEEAKRRREFLDWCNSMIGKDYHEVVNRLGLPGQTLDMPNGNKTLIFERGVPGVIPRFETDPNGIVIGWTP